MRVPELSRADDPHKKKNSILPAHIFLPATLMPDVRIRSLRLPIGSLRR